MPAGTTSVIGTVMRAGDQVIPVFWVGIDRATGTGEIVAAVSGKKITVVAIDFTITSAGSVGWNSAGNVVRQPQPFAASGGIANNYFPGWFVQTNTGEALNAVVVGGPMRGGLWYVLV